MNVSLHKYFAMTLYILKDEIKDYQFASAFTFVRTIGQHENDPKSTSCEEDNKTIFQIQKFFNIVSIL